MAKANISAENSGALVDALRRARALEAAHFDAVYAFNDAKSLRLQLLKDDLDPLIQASREAGEAFELSMSPGETPRLWIDLITSVVMEPDPKTYRLIEDGRAGRELVFETSDRAEMTEKIKQLLAHRIIARQRLGAKAGLNGNINGRYSTASLILAWLSGFALGALALVIAAIYLKILRF